MERTILENIEKGYCYIDDDLLIITSSECRFEKGTIPKEKIFVKCENCGKLHPIQLGQGDICNHNECECGYDFGYITTYELFEQTNVWFLYSDPKYLDFAGSKNLSLNSNISLCERVSKIIGESFFEHSWDINDGSSITPWEYINDHNDEYLLIHKDDIKTLLYVCNKVPMENIIILDNNKAYKIIDSGLLFIKNDIIERKPNILSLGELSDADNIANKTYDFISILESVLYYYNCPEEIKLIKSLIPLLKRTPQLAEIVVHKQLK